MALNFKNPNQPNYINLPKNPKPEEVVFALVSAGEPFLALAYLSEGYKQKSYKGPEEAGNITAGIGINFSDMSPDTRAEYLRVAGCPEAKIKQINHSFAKGNPIAIELSLEQALTLADHYNKTNSSLAAERRFGSDFINSLPPMRRAAVEYLYFHYGEDGANKMKTLMNKISNEGFANLGGSVTSNRRYIAPNGQEILFPNSRTGLILDLAFKDMDNGEFFALAAAENLPAMESFAAKFEQKAKSIVNNLSNNGSLKFSGNPIPKVSDNTHQYLAKLDKNLYQYTEAQKKPNIDESEYLDIIRDRFVEKAMNKGIVPEIYGKETAMNNEERTYYDYEGAEYANIKNMVDQHQGSLFEKIPLLSDVIGLFNSNDTKPEFSETVINKNYLGNNEGVEYTA